MTAIILGAIHGVIVYIAGIWFKSKFALIAAAILVCFFAFATGNPIYVGFDIFFIVTGVYVGWLELSQLPPNERKTKKIQSNTYSAQESDSTTIIWMILLTIVAVIIFFIISKSPENNQQHETKSLGASVPVPTLEPKMPISTPNQKYSTTPPKSSAREKSEVKVEATNNNSASNCYNLKTDREILNCLDSQ